MKVHALVTNKVISGEWPVKHISYSREDDDVFVMVTHADTWELNAMQPVRWDVLNQKVPSLATVAFKTGYHLLTLNQRTCAWDEARE